MKKFNKQIVYVVLVLTPMLFSRCTLSEDLTKIQNSLDSVKIYIGTPKFLTTVNLRFVDAKTHEPISDKVVSVNISGKDSAKVYNNTGSRADTYFAHEGRLDLVIDPHAVDTSAIKTNPIQFVVTPTLSGYMSAPQIVSITNAKRSYVEVPMMNMSNPPDGIAIFQNIDVGTTDVNGALTQSKTVSFVKDKSGRLKSAGNETISYGNISVEIPAGAIFKDVNGNPLAGNVSMYGWYGNYAFIDTYNFSDRNKALYSQNYYFMFFYVNNNWVRTIVNGDIKIKFFLPDNEINNITKLSWKKNDVIPFWQYGSDWLLHNTKNDTIKSVNNHLFIEQSGKYSYPYFFPPDSFICSYGYWGFQIPVCPDITFNYNFVSNPAYGGTIIEQTLSNNLLDYWFGFYFSNSFSNFKWHLNFLPLGYTTTHTFSLYPWWKDPDYTYQISPQQIITTDGSCGNTYNITFTQTANPNVKFITLNLDISLVSNKKTVFKPNAWFYMSEITWYNGFEFYLDAGKALITLKSDREYIIYNWLGNEWLYRYIIIKDKGTEYEISVSTDANNSNVIGTYKFPKSDVVYFKLNIPISDNLFNSL